MHISTDTKNDIFVHNIMYIHVTCIYLCVKNMQKETPSQQKKKKKTHLQ